MSDETVHDGHHLSAGDVAEGVQLALGRALDDAGFHQRRQVALGKGADLVRVRELGQSLGVRNGGNAQRAGQHHHGFLPGDGGVGHGLAVVAQHDAGSRTAVHRVGAPGLVGDVGETGALSGGQLQKTGQHGGHLAAGQVAVGIELAVVTLDHAVAAPALDGSFRPGPLGVAIGPLGGSAQRQQAERHRHRNYDRQNFLHTILSFYFLWFPRFFDLGGRHPVRPVICTSLLPDFRVRLFTPTRDTAVSCPISRNGSAPDAHTA